MMQNSRRSGAPAVQTRFAISMIGNALRAILLAATSIFLARTLSSTQFGEFQFLLLTALAIRQLADLGATQAFFTLLSRNIGGKIVIGSFYIGGGIQFLVSLLAVFGISHSYWYTKIFVNQPISSVLISLCAAFTYEGLWGSTANALESRRLTTAVQIGGVAAAFLNLITLISLWNWGRLDIDSALSALAAVYFILSLILWGFFWLAGEKSETRWDLAQTSKYYRDFCSPIIFMLVAQFAYTFADPWLLQHFAGAAQQGYFGISQQFSAIALLATISLLRVFWKETAEALEFSDLTRVHDLYMRSQRLLYSFACMVSAPLIVLSPKIVDILLGSQYTDARIPFSIMLIVPWHQSLIQLNNTFLLAAKKTQIYATINIVAMSLSIPVAYFFLARTDSTIPGLALGSSGLPFKIILVQVLTATAQHIAICRIYKWETRWLFQIAIPLVVLPIAAAANFVSEFLLIGNDYSGIQTAVLTLVAYSITIGGILLKQPRWLCLDSHDIEAVRRIAAGSKNEAII